MAPGDFVHYDLGQLEAGQVVEVSLEHRANVLLLDATNFRHYQNSEDFQYIGGEALESPLTLAVPHDGHWHVALDLGGAAGSIKSAVRVL